MSVFVDPNKTINLNVKLKYTVNESGEKVFFRVLDEEYEEKADENIELIECKVKYRDYDTMSKILEEATIINHVNAQPMIRMWMFRRLIILNFFKSWTLKNEEGNIMSINSDNIGKIQYSVIKLLADKWIKETTNA